MDEHIENARKLLNNYRRLEGFIPRHLRYSWRDNLPIPPAPIPARMTQEGSWLSIEDAVFRNLRGPA